MPLSVRRTCVPGILRYIADVREKTGHTEDFTQ